LIHWAVETLNETVDAEVGALPEDMRARLARISLLMEQKGIEQVGEPHVKTYRGPLVGNENPGTRRDLSGALRDGSGPARGDPKGFCQEN
jgi:hypothetical protein